MIAGEITIKSGLRAAAMALPDMVEKRLDAIAESAKSIMQASLQTSNNGGTTPSAPGKSPHRGSGELVRAVSWRKPATMVRDIGVFDSSMVKFAHRLEYGTYAQNRERNFMTVPISDMAKRHQSRNRGAGTFPKPLFKLYARDGRVFLAERKRGVERPIIHYWLAKHVDLEPRPFVRPVAGDAKLRDQITRLFSDMADEIASQTFESVIYGSR